MPLLRGRLDAYPYEHLNSCYLMDANQQVLTGQLPFYGVDLDKLHDMPQSEWWRMMPQVKGTSVTDRHFLSLCWDDNLACRPYMSEAIVMLDSKLKQAIREEQAMSQKAKSKPKPFWRIWG